jgi:hypothetical protein
MGAGPEQALTAVSQALAEYSGREPDRPAAGEQAGAGVGRG